MRSKGPAINEVAAKYGGGGHLKAAAGKVETEKEIPNLLKDLNEIKKMAA